MQEDACRKSLGEDEHEIHVFTDLNRSGKETSRRSGYLEMMRLVDDGRIAIGAVSPDRLYQAMSDPKAKLGS